MRWGLVADVHGNIEALDAVLKALDEGGVDRIICLGDLVGFNAASDACIARLRDRNATVVAGNHDLIAIARLGFERCGPKPAFALRRTRRTLADVSKTYLATLPLHLSLPEGVVLFHGSFNDAQEYLRTPRALSESARLAQTFAPNVHACFFGHTHDPVAVHVRNDEVVPLPTTPSCRWANLGGVVLINPGSVDGARRDEKVAQFALFDPEAKEVIFRAVPYDHQASERRAIQEGYRMSQLRMAALKLRRRIGRLRARVMGRTP